MSYAVKPVGGELVHGKIRVVKRTDDYSEVVVIENSIESWVGNNYFITSADTYMAEHGNTVRINLYTDSKCTQKAGNGMGGDMWVTIEGAEHGLLDGTDVRDSMLSADPEKFAFLVPLPRGKDGMLATITYGDAGQQGEVTISPNPVQLYEFYETSDRHRRRRFVIIKNADNNVYNICEVADITFATEVGN